MIAVMGRSVAASRPAALPQSRPTRGTCGTIRRRARRSIPRRAPLIDHPIKARGSPTLAKTPRTWTGARTPSGLKRVRQAQSRHEVLQPRRSAAKTYVAKALSAAAQPAGSTIDPVAALAEALSALDRAAKVGAIHPNAAARRKSRLTRKVNAALGGEHVQTGGRVVKTTGKAAAAKAAKARIAAGKAGKAKGAQTAAGKARAALSKTARAEAAAAKAAAEASSCRRPPAEAAPAHDQGRGCEEAGRREDDRRPPKKAAARQGGAEGDGQGRAEDHEEGRDQGVERRARRRTTTPRFPGAFRFRAPSAPPGSRRRSGRASGPHGFEATGVGDAARI